MAERVFYSWQSDLPNNINRGFIEDALKKAIVQLGRDDDELFIPQRNLEIDKDTKGVPGSPPIADTIFEKISNCSVFVADLTFVGTTTDGCPIPNPNVLIEYGYAQAKRGHLRIVGVMNAAYGNPDWETLPFNLRHKKWPIAYTLTEKSTSAERLAQKKDLAGNLVVALREALREPTDAAPDFTLMQSKSRVSSFLDDGDVLCTLIPRWGLGRDERGEIVWRGGSQMFMRVIPDVPVAEKTPLALLELIQKFPLPPFGGGVGVGVDYAGNEWGAVSFSVSNLEDRQKAVSVSQVSERGEIWGIDCDELTYNSVPFFEYMFARKLAQYLTFAKYYLGITSDVTVIAGMTGVVGMPIRLPDPPKGMSYRMPIFEVGKAAKDEIVVRLPSISIEPSEKSNLEIADNFPYKMNDPLICHTYEVLMPLFEKAWGIFMYNRLEHLPRIKVLP